jgi:hypothetical protein
LDAKKVNSGDPVRLVTIQERQFKNFCGVRLYGTGDKKDNANGIRTMVDVSRSSVF